MACRRAEKKWSDHVTLRQRNRTNHEGRGNIATALPARNEFERVTRLDVPRESTTFLVDLDADLETALAMLGVVHHDLHDLHGRSFK